MVLRVMRSRGRAALSDFSELARRLLGGLSNLRTEVPKVLADPRSHPQEALALAGISAVALLLVALIAMLAFDTVQRLGSRKNLGVKRRNPVRMRMWLWSAAVVIAVCVLLGIAPLVPAVGSACGRCHAVSAAVRSWEADPHAQTSCYACHARPGVLGALQASGSGLSRVIGTNRVKSTESGSCLKCHEDLMTGVFDGRYLRVRHSDMVEAGMDCLVCHADVGHTERQPSAGAVNASPQMKAGSLPTSQRSMMGRCLLCHDGEAAPAACPTCHKGSTLDRVTEIQDGWTVQTRSSCTGCHSQALEMRCEACHGLEMPHPAAFRREHARLSSQDAALCARCHESASETDVCACHDPGETHGDLSRWFARHSTAAIEMWPGGCRCHTVNDCTFCHVSEISVGE